MKTRNNRALTILILLITTILLSSATTSPYYTKSVVITKVFPHKLGYKVFYMANDLVNREAYLPNSMFGEQKSGDTERSRIFSGYDKAYPYMTIFWRDGVFSHVKLYIKSDYGDTTWGAFANPSDHDDRFRNAELKFDF